MEALLIFAIVIVAAILFFLFRFGKYCTTPVIDAVMTYVDGSDPVWIAEKEKYSQAVTNETLNSRNRWRWESNEEGKYCILSIKRNAVFFRKIFLVLSGPSQIPLWLPEVAAVEPQIPIEIVYHRDFFENPADCPTFNSISIEANLHRIRGLSEYFVYFNDDCLVNRPISLRDFVSCNGKLRVGVEEKLVAPRGTAV